MDGNFVWACKNYDGDVQSDTVAQGFGSLDLMTISFNSPMEKPWNRSSTRNVTRHYRDHQAGKALLHQSYRQHFAWTRGLAFRGSWTEPGAY